VRIKTILKQSYQDFELILLDDCSTDNSVEILSSYKNHSKVSHLLINPTNSGSPFKQWVKGIKLAKGDYIWIAESDDYCELNFLEKLMESMYEGGVVLAFCASNIIDESGTKKGRHKWADALNPTRWESSFKNTGKNEIMQYLRYRNTITNASAVIFKAIAVKNITYPLDMKFCGDWYFWIEILKQGNIVYEKQQLNYFRRHATTTRYIKPFHLEKQRFQEYLQIIKSNSTVLSRLLNLKRYVWVLNEWNFKKEHFPKNALDHFDLPIEFSLFAKIKSNSKYSNE